jgi:hypothetical protein
MKRRAVQCAGNFEFVVVDRRNRLRRKQGQRIGANYHRNVERLVAGFRLLVKGMQVTRQHQDRHTVFSMHLNPVNGYILDSRDRIARDHHAGSDIRPVVMFAVRGNRQRGVQIDVVALHDLLAWRIR